jgi:hypothetical protein
MPSGQGIALFNRSANYELSEVLVNLVRYWSFAFRGIPNGFRSPDHAGGGVFHDDKSLVAPVHEIRAFPDKDPS